MSLSSALPLPGIHVHMEGVPPAETLFAGQETHISTPATAPGATYSFI